jgi:predicted NACHT family NTPase
MSAITEIAELSQLISVRGRFVRSVHIERDYHQPSVNGYQLTQCAVSVLEALQTAFDKPAERALTIVGPYGAGKSAFCVHLARLFTNQIKNGKSNTP